MNDACAAAGYARDKGEKVESIVFEAYTDLFALGRHSVTLEAMCEAITLLVP